MNNMQVKDKKNHKKQLGASLVEYGLLIALVSVVLIVSVKAVGDNVRLQFREVAREGFSGSGFGPCGFPLPPC